MTLSAYWQASLLLLAAGSLAAQAGPPDTAAVADTIKSDVAQIVAGLNAHDAAKTTAYDAPNILAMECGSAPLLGRAADSAGFASGFADDRDWHVSLIDQSVDVAGSGDLAVYRGTYHEYNGGDTGVLVHTTIFLAEFRRQPAAPWKMVWYSVSNVDRAHLP